MAEFLHLDAAAKAVGKSEVTLRRLVRAGKVPFEREKTLTGFIYLVDPVVIRAYYAQRGSLGLGSDPSPRIEREPESAAKVAAAEPKEAPRHAVASQGRMRVAVSDESGDPVAYWLRRAETYEDRYHREVEKTGHLREELGLWRGRAEHAQSLLLKLLPSPGTVEVSANAASTPTAHPQVQRKLSPAGIVVIVMLPIALVLAAALIYLVIKK